MVLSVWWSVVAVDEVVWTMISGSWRREEERGVSNGGRRGGIERKDEGRKEKREEERREKRREEERTKARKKEKRVGEERKGGGKG